MKTANRISGPGATAMAALLAVATTSAATASAAPDTFAREAARYVDRAWPSDGPGAAVLVMRNGKVLYAGAQGRADLETGENLTPDSVFRLGSITKQFTAAAVLKLRDDGRLSLDDPLARFLPDYPGPGADVTIRQLLNHTSGIQSYTGIPGWMTEANTNRDLPTADLIAEFQDEPLTFEAGTKWAYNNSGYVLLGAILESVTGKAWHDVIREEIAEPLGLDSLHYGETADPDRMVKGYTDRGDGPVPAMAIHMSIPHGAGGLAGDLDDLAKWTSTLHAGAILSKDSYAQMIAPTLLPDGEEIPYGYGLSFDEVRGRKTIGHGGGIFGFLTASYYLPEEDLFVAAFANSDSPEVAPGVVAQRLVAAAIGDPYPTFEAQAPDMAALEPLFGVYQIAEESSFQLQEEGDSRRFYAKDGKLFTLRKGRTATEVFAAGGNRFFYGPGSLTWFEVKAQDDGSHRMHMHQNGAAEAELAIRTGPIPEGPQIIDLDPQIADRYAGTYRAENGATAAVTHEGGELRLSFNGQRPDGILPVSDTAFVGDGVDAKIVFAREGETVTSLTIYQGDVVLEMRRE